MRSDQLSAAAQSSARAAAGLENIERALRELLERWAILSDAMLTEGVDRSYVSQLAGESAREFCQVRRDSQ